MIITSSFLLASPYSTKHLKGKRHRNIFLALRVGYWAKVALRWYWNVPFYSFFGKVYKTVV